MKKIIGLVREILIAAIVLIFVIGVWLGSILQTSYRLCPVTAEEIAEVAHD